MQTIRLGILGLGTVGQAVVRLLARNQPEITRRTGCQIQCVAALVQNQNKKRDCDLTGIALAHDLDEVINNPDVDVVVELMGGIEYAKCAIELAIAAKKPVITANKALIAQHGNELLARASQQGVPLCFEAAVAGSIPIVKVIKEGYSANQITGLFGIVNGTSNYILSEMSKHLLPFSDVLAKAQKAGYAEADPSFDVDGIDAAHKLTILSALAFNMPLRFSEVYIQGIRDISPADIQYTQQLGYCIKQVAIAHKQDSQVRLQVYPALLPRKHILSQVDGVMNAIFLESNAAGSSLHYGAGAGGLPTASAVLADVIDIIRRDKQKVSHPLGYDPASLEAVTVDAIDNLETAYYLRLQVPDRPGILAEITHFLAAERISIESLLQKYQPSEQFSSVPIVILTHITYEHAIQKAIKNIAALPDIHEKIVCLRVLATLVQE